MKKCIDFIVAAIQAAACVAFVLGAIYTVARHVQ